MVGLLFSNEDTLPWLLLIVFLGIWDVEEHRFMC